MPSDSPNPDPISDRHTRFQTWPLRIRSSLRGLEQQQNWNSHISLSFFSFEIETKNTFVHSRSSFETIHVPDSRFQMGKFSTRFRTKAAQIPTPLGGTYLSGLYRGVPPPPGGG